MKNRDFHEPCLSHYLTLQLTPVTFRLQNPSHCLKKETVDLRSPILVLISTANLWATNQFG
jgi:hypothetical protein